MPDIELEFEQPFVGSAYSPQVVVTPIEHGHDVAITYRDIVGGITTLTFDVLNGDASDPGGVGTLQLADGAVTNPKLADGAVTAPKLDVTVALAVDGSGDLTISLT